MRRRPTRLALGVLLLGCVAVAMVTLTSGGSHYRLRVQMGDAAGLRKDFLVKIAGAPVGKVVDVQLDHADHATAVLQLDEGAGPVGTDARAAIRASNLLGEKYVDLTPGDVGHPAPSGFEIPRTRTSTPSDLADVLAVLDPDTRVALGAFLVGQGDALVGRGQDLAAALVKLPPTLDAARQLVSGLAAHNRDLGALVERSDRIAQTLAPQRRALGRLVTNANGALGAINARRAALGQTIQGAPSAISQLHGSLSRLEQAARPLGPAALGLQASAVPLAATLRALPGFVRSARPTLRTARSIAPALTRLGQQAEPVVQRLQPAGSSLRTFATSLDPVSKLLDDGSADTLGVLQGWARSIQNRDNVGHVFRVSVELGGDVLKTLNSYVKTPAKPKRPGHKTGVQSLLTKHPTPSGSASPHPVIQLPKIELPKVTLPPLVDSGSATEAVHQLLDYLLK